MPDNLVEMMLTFGSAVRPYMAAEMRGLAMTAGLTERELDILEFVARQGKATFSDIAEYAQERGRRGASNSRVSAALSALYSRHRLVDKRVNPEDQRQPIVTVTPKGRRLVDQVSELRTSIYEKIRAAMNPSESEANTLERVFQRGLTNFRQFLDQR